MMDINTLSQFQAETQHITTDQQSEPKQILESQWIYLGGERICKWVMIDQ